MAIELHLQKTTKTPWGFRLAGGAEYEVPLTVIKVTENSIAENAGMQEGDAVVRIDDIPTAGLTHDQAHDALLAAGNDFIIAVRRGDLSHLPPRLLFYETSVENAEDMVDNETTQIYGDAQGNHDRDLNITDEEIVNIIGEQVHISSQATDESSIKVEEIHTSKEEMNEEISIVHRQSEVSKVIFNEESQQTQEKKWSTFLQKPKNPKPKLKETKASKAPPYRVIIKKQPKRDQQTSNEAANIEREEYESDDTFIEEKQLSNSIEDITSQPQIVDDINNEDINEENNVDKTTDGDTQSNDDENEREEENETPEPIENKEKEETETPTGEREPSSAEKRLSINLEEQLAQVRRQLEALAQLPSAIQQTLNAVTQQLTEIALTKHTQEQEVIAEVKVTVQEEMTEEHLEMSEEHEEKALSVVEEESYEHYEEEETKEEIREDMIECIRNESEEEQALFEELEKQIEEEEERKRQEEIETLRIEQERIQKKDKERRSLLPRTPLQRPIILPGGRKWSNPDDATPKIRRPSMTDEKIANTINMFSEVIVGRTKGINFLKYQPPPKSLEHLHNSAVYRLVHHTEPPPRGVIARDGKVLAEQDYYVEKQKDGNLSAEMGR